MIIHGINDYSFDDISHEKSPPDEKRLLLAEIEEARKKIAYAWNHLDYADPEYVEIAVLELLLAETSYCLLNKRYRLLLGMKEESPVFLTCTPNTTSFSLESLLLNHAFYSTMFNSKTENSLSISSPLTSSNP